MPEPKTFVYKTVGNLDIKIDIYTTDQHANRPVIVWIHGGAMITGGRLHEGLMLDMIGQLLDDGFVVASIDYRLAPETKLPESYKDVQDAAAWIRTEGPDLFGADPERLAFFGASAGGFLTLASGFLVNPRPRCLVSFFGYGQLDGDWLTQPSPDHFDPKAFTEDEARATVGAEPVAELPKDHQRGNFYRWTRQNGVWPIEVTGFDPVAQPEAYDRLCPDRNVTPDYPPTMLLHGDDDHDVPYGQSVRMAERLEQAGIEHKLILFPGAGHGFIGKLKERTDIADAWEDVRAFFRKQLAPRLK